jgi:hypothetical protein
MKKTRCPSVAPSAFAPNIFSFGDVLYIRTYPFHIQDLMENPKEVIEKSDAKFLIKDIDIESAISLYNENKLSAPHEDELDFEELANLSAPIDLANFNSFEDLNINVPLSLIAFGTKNKTLIKRFIKVNNIFVIDLLIANINLTEQDLLELIAQIKADAKSGINTSYSERLFAKISKHLSATENVLKQLSKH